MVFSTACANIGLYRSNIDFCIKNMIIYIKKKKIWNASRICVSSLRRGHANLLCIVPILVYVLPKQVHLTYFCIYILTHGTCILVILWPVLVGPNIN